MAHQLTAVIVSESPEKMMELMQLLEENTRPCFEEDAPVQWRSVFSLIEGLDYPTEIEVEEEGCRLWIHWFEKDGLSFGDIAFLVKKSSFRLLVAYEVSDYAMSGDSEQDDECFWVPVDNEFRCISRDQLSTYCSGDIVREFCDDDGLEVEG